MRTGRESLILWAGISAPRRDAETFGQESSGLRNSRSRRTFSRRGMPGLTARYRAAQKTAPKLLSTRKPKLTSPAADSFRPARTRIWDEYDSKNLLGNLRHPGGSEKSSGSVGAAVASARQMGFPVVLETRRGQSCKTESGMVLSGHHLNRRS